MSVSQLEDKPAYVVFEKRAVEDRTASIATGVYVSKDVDFVIVTPAGSKDRIERNAAEWFDNMRQQVKAQRLPEAWLLNYQQRYEAWRHGQEIPAEGTSVRNWPVLSPAQAKSLADANVRTVEELANANEETLMRLGMGSRALKNKAVEWVSASGKGGVGAQIEELLALREKCAVLGGTVKSQQIIIGNLETQLQSQRVAPRPDSMTAAMAADDGDDLSFLKVT